MKILLLSLFFATRAFAQNPEAVADLSVQVAPTPEVRGIPGLKKIGYVDLKVNSGGGPAVALGVRFAETWFLGIEGTRSFKSFTDKTDLSIPHDYSFRLGAEQWRLALTKAFTPFRLKDFSFGAGIALGKETTRASYDFYNVLGGHNVDRGITESDIESAVGVISADFRYTPTRNFLDWPISMIVGVEGVGWRGSRFTFKIRS